MMRTQAILKLSLGPFFQRVGKVVMMRAQAPLGFPLWPFFQRLWKSVMMRTRAVLNLLEVFPATSESRHDARAKTQNVVAYPSDTWYALTNGAQAQNREPHERRIGDGDGKVD